MKRNPDRNRHSGGAFEAFLEQEGIRDEVYDHAVKAVLAWQFVEVMKSKRISKKRMAEQLHTSRTQVDRLLDPNNDAVSLSTLKKAATAVGKRIRLELVDA